MTSAQKLSKNRREARRNLWFERAMAIIATINFLVVLFDVTYLPLRNFWLQGRIQLFSFKVGPFETEGIPIQVPLPPVTAGYDWVKGIEPYRDTEQYLARVEELEDQVIATSLRSPEVEQILADLRERSVDMIETNPFQIANKTGTLEKIKNEMREYLEEEFAKDAFQNFWTQEYLEREGFTNSLTFFNTEIKPLLETNFYRPLGENGEFVDNFALFDFAFEVMFFLEFLARTWFISSRRKGISWFDAMLWRWYDFFFWLPMFIPFQNLARYIRLMRIIPVIIRLNQAQLINLDKIQKQASQGFVAGIAEDVTEVVIIRVLNQVQTAIRDGEIMKILESSRVKPYVDLNDVNETAELTKLMTQLMVDEVIPKVRPDLEALLKYNIDKTIHDFPAYQAIKQFPGVEDTENRLVTQLVSQIYQILYDNLKNLTKEDPVNDQLMSRLLENLGQTLGNELQGQDTLQRTQYLLDALIEEVKVNYVERLSQEDIEQILDQTRALREKATQQYQETRLLSDRP
ncbi:MAG: hypothetical protein SAJ37_20875 [Oscillatoria sp. PMC 1068.18]|nr:hypothetical protein [Oscillatoria sp. PMC 1076.18]MEC4991196.1 hypothetical protein [Oscillatoria sp. PMC 1068.18]